MDLYFPANSAVLSRADPRLGEKTLAQLVREKVPALGPKAQFNGIWWLPGYVCTLCQWTSRWSKVVLLLTTSMAQRRCTDYV